MLFNFLVLFALLGVPRNGGCACDIALLGVILVIFGAFTRRGCTFVFVLFVPRLGLLECTLA